MTRIGVFGGTGYLASLIKNQNNIKNNRYTFFSRKKISKNYVDYFSFKKKYNALKNFDIFIHLAGPNQNQLKKNKNLLKKRSLITSNICDFCLSNNVKLIYLSSLQIYKNYGKSNLKISSKINQKNLYSLSHHESEKIITKKFSKNKKMFTILRMGNVFGLIKYNNMKEITNNLIHNLCILGLKKKKIFIQNGSIQRSFVPSQVFIYVINLIIKKQIFNNSIINISYKSLNLKEVAQIIEKRLKLIFKIRTITIIKKFNKKKKFSIYSNKSFKLYFNDRKIRQEIDRILKIIKKEIK